MENILLIELLEKVLGTGVPTSNNNYKFYCPQCKHSKRKLEVNLTNYSWNCWVCGVSNNFKGVKLTSLFKKLNVTGDKLTELAKLTKTHVFVDKSFKVAFKLSLPNEFKPINTDTFIARAAKSYLQKRGITDIDVKRYNIGFCETGIYEKMIVIPSYNINGELNYFSTRSFDEKAYKKTQNPPTSKNVIGFEAHINWNVPIIICEGALDAISIRRNAIPLYGKIISQELLKKIIESKVEKIYIALDNDALKDAIKHCETLLSYGKKVYLIEMDGKDPNSMGFENFTLLAQKTKKLTFSKLLELKMKT